MNKARTKNMELEGGISLENNHQEFGIVEELYFRGKVGG